MRLFSLMELGTAGNRLWHATSARYNSSLPVPVRDTSDSNTAESEGKRDGLANAIGQDQERFVIIQRKFRGRAIISPKFEYSS